jgi:MFS family permease
MARGCEKPDASRRRRGRKHDMGDKLLGGGRAVFRIRDYSLYCASRFLWGVGHHVQTIAIAWLVYELTHDPLKLGLIGLTAFVPAVPLALVAGPVADRYDRRTIIILCSAAMAVASVAVLLMLLTGFIHAGRTWPLYAAVLVFGAARAFSGPAGQALVMSLVPKEQFTSAAAWNNTINQSATILGPAIGGLLIPFGNVVPFAVAFAALTASALLATLIHARMAKGGKPPVTFEMLVAGYRFIWKTPVILGSITLDLIAVMLAGVTALLPIFARDIFEAGPWGLGVLRSMPAVGSVCAALILANFTVTFHVGRTMIGSVFIYGVATLAFGMTTSIFVGMACLVVIGAADMVSVVIRQTLIQVEAPDDMRGRVVAVHSVTSGSANHLGEFESGVMARLVGVVPTVLLGGAAAVGSSVAWVKLFPTLWARERF